MKIDLEKTSTGLIAISSPLKEKLKVDYPTPLRMGKRTGLNFYFLPLKQE